MSAIAAYPPKPGAKVQVIGAGLPRTGTNSFCAALEILLKGPAYHVGVQTALSDSEHNVKTWISILRKRKSASTFDREQAMTELKHLLEGYVVTADPPLSLLVPELMQLYPDAKVICTVRDVKAWVASMEALLKLVHPRLQKLIFFWVRGLRWLPTMWDYLPGLFQERYGFTISDAETARGVWERHHAWLEEIVPKEKLFYVNVKDGWEPLCKALDVPVPKRVEYPRLNDGKELDGFFKKWAIQGLTRWAMVLLVLVGGVVGWAVFY